MSTLFLTRGLPASGKTTWARELVRSRAVGSIIRLNRDDLRRSLVDPEYRSPQYAAEQRITAVQREAARNALLTGADVVVDDTNLRLKYAREWATLADECGAALSVADFPTDVEECVRRDAARSGVEQVGEHVIRDMHGKFVAALKGGPFPDITPVGGAATHGKPYTPVPGTPKAVMVDIDGTVALHGDRSPYDTSRYHEDQTNGPIVDLVRLMSQSGHRVLFCSGRDADHRDVTAAWLDEHVGVPHEGLFMRRAGDRRNDAVVKLELFDRHIREHYDVVAVLDDRDRVVKAWRSIGLTVLQVAEGRF